MCGVDCGRWLGTAQQSVTAQRGALAAVKSNRRATVVLTSSVKIPRLTFHRHLLEGVRSASERSRPPKTTTRARGREGALRPKMVSTKKGCPTAALRGARVARRLPRNAAVRELGGSGCAGCPSPPSCRAQLCCAYRCDALPRDDRRCRMAASMAVDDAHKRSVNDWGACDDVRRAAAALAAANAPHCTTLRT